jgi:hypothetical protein
MPHIYSNTIVIGALLLGALTLAGCGSCCTTYDKSNPPNNPGPKPFPDIELSACSDASLFPPFPSGAATQTSASGSKVYLVTPQQSADYFASVINNTTYGLSPSFIGYDNIISAGFTLHLEDQADRIGQYMQDVTDPAYFNATTDDAAFRQYFGYVSDSPKEIALSKGYNSDISGEYAAYIASLQALGHQCNNTFGTWTCEQKDNATNVTYQWHAIDDFSYECMIMVPN